MRAGVVRDIPELDIYTENINRHMHAEYCDRGYGYDKDFLQDDRIKIIVIGSSFGRDWINVLLESSIADKLDISYINAYIGYLDSNIESRKSRLENADYIFFVVSTIDFTDVPECLQEYYESGKLYLVGNKNFGQSNGIAYNRRGQADYLKQSIVLDNAYLEQNDLLREAYKENFIDLIGILQKNDGTIPIFTPDGKFISQDCTHLTQAGAQYYASILDLTWILK